ncbi:MAG: tRNA (N6-threonylcarbamoyladenosine(37)-N6)-methyltransferase TrmO [Thermoplasmata archaeon]|nr:tRNA (N6-threonylcarbamoyladenosine(37)-N6)-methyltransferase TrmO [Thermoplasmata archaeon]NIS12805.1 tRNA (N6-threonylcarbamoyladenosine(37)-N6)-methyltransferase TrmO [Thermoplasmata archaeon]NIS20706.1 tRNA (N6-threonylcarbamoyladenosine(37)-N6)-methyltransferase TrmO [Thermoplasmata archaeon]NIT78110.1 tRNA (N6-threonylcarbamoyladenosine(37)-N6)-methyltransferase TrmO [Thermoplasmata archaeon]NIU49781.1 tRNA (N6-threonylcarbamoyladenosine(37)-N6)-methyltransferase TrmO [Thermoplasmata a
MQESSSMEVHPIGTVRSPYTSTGSIPLCASEKLDEEATVQVLPECVEGLADLDGFSHVILLVHMHKATTTKLTVHPPVDDSGMARGVFATRSPLRPNHIGLSIVELVRIEGGEMHVRGIDLLDGTPVLDIKPYTPYDARSPVVIGWLEGRAAPQG